MEYADRLRTAAMSRLLSTFEDGRMWDSTPGGVAQMTPSQLVIEQMRKEEDTALGGTDAWMYTTTIEVTVTRRRVG